MLTTLVLFAGCLTQAPPAVQAPLPPSVQAPLPPVPVEVPVEAPAPAKVISKIKTVTWKEGQEAGFTSYKEWRESLPEGWINLADARKDNPKLTYKEWHDAMMALYDVPEPAPITPTHIVPPVAKPAPQPVVQQPQPQPQPHYYYPPQQQRRWRWVPFR